ncbi:MAG: hypothetical protein QOE09_310 [Ilumatobacteraceae bacterium]|jgi:hypothetical protein
MFKLPALTALSDSPLRDFPGLDFSGLDLSALRNRLPSIDTTKLAADTAKLTRVVRDAAYIAVGLGVTSIERTQARGEQLAAIVTNRFEQARGLVRTAV